MRPKAHRHFLIAACGPLFLTATISAQTVRTWDGGPAGNGTVLTTAANWSGDVLPASTGNTTATRHDAQWDGSVGGDLNLTFGSAFGGSFGVGLVMTAAQTGNLTLTNSAVSTQNLRIVNGGATTGGIQIASGAGALTIGAAGTSNPIQLVLGQGAVGLNYYFANNSANTATIEENVTIVKGGSHAASLIFSAGNWNVKGVVSDLGAGGLNVNAGAVTLSANNTFTAAVNVNGGTLSISAANNLGTGTGAVRLGQTTTSGTLQFTGSSNATISRLMRVGNGASAGQTGSGTITNIGTGVLTFDNATFNEVGATAAGVNRSLTLSGNNTGNNTISGVIANNNPGLVSVVKSGTGKWILSGDNTFSNGVSIDEGTLVVGHANALGSGTINLRADASGEVARLQSNGTDRTFANAVTFGGAEAATANYLGGAGTGNLTFNGDVNWGSATKTYTIDGSTVTFGGAWTGASATNINTIAGTDVATSLVIMDGDRGTTAKEINVENGVTVRANHANSFGSNNTEPLVVIGGTATGVVELTNDITLARTLVVNGRDVANTSVGARNLSGDNSIVLSTGGGGTRYNIESTAGTLTISSLAGLTGDRDLFVTGAGNVTLSNWNSRRDLTMNGTGTLTMGGSASSLSGTGTVNSGTLVLNATSGVGALAATGGLVINNTATVVTQGVGNSIGTTTAVTVNTGGLLDMRKNNTIGALAGGGTVRNTTTTDYALTVNNDNGTSSFGGVIEQGSTGKINLIKNGTGTLTLTGTNTYNGTTTVSAGTLNIGSGGSISSATSISANGTLEISTGGSVSTPGNLSIASAGTLKLAGGSLSANGGSGYILNSGTYDVNGQTVALTSYEASLMNANSKLQNSSATAATILGWNGIANKNTVWINATGVSIETVGDLDIQSIVTHGGSNNGFTKTGDGTLTLSNLGNGLGSGTVAVSAGTLYLSGNLGAGSVDVGSAGTIGGDGTLTGNLAFLAGADFLFDPLTTLTVNDGTSASTVSFAGFSITDLAGLTNAVANGTYTLMDGTATFDFTNVSNFGLVNAYDLGGGKKAYFESGSLNLVVIPEPRAALLGGLGLLALLRRRRN